MVHSRCGATRGILQLHGHHKDEHYGHADCHRGQKVDDLGGTIPKEILRGLLVLPLAAEGREKVKDLFEQEDESTLLRCRLSGSLEGGAGETASQRH